MDKVSNIIRKASDTKSVFEEKYFKNYYNGKSNTHLFHEKLPKEVVHCFRIAIIVLNLI